MVLNEGESTSRKLPQPPLLLLLLLLIEGLLDRSNHVVGSALMRKKMMMSLQVVESQMLLLRLPPLLKSMSHTELHLINLLCCLKVLYIEGIQVYYKQGRVVVCHTCC